MALYKFYCIVQYSAVCFSFSVFLCV